MVLARGIFVQHRSANIRYNGVNVANGYRPLTIVTPMEIVREDAQKKD
jgi:hypothetical protein